ncbi:hypothetical protein AVEN_273116-1 [Araneus ventricosus]|uniref:Uncharacterized protein n=1 Tax=Araneus ventricosus TaxID=182803 RepID=A0A4Y2PIL2_ARAVE|nr:hypothetical protein AVEN_273116-1 [Araneus ventricosus]
MPVRPTNSDGSLEERMVSVGLHLRNMLSSNNKRNDVDLSLNAESWDPSLAVRILDLKRRNTWCVALYAWWDGISHRTNRYWSDSNLRHTGLQASIFQLCHVNAFIPSECMRTR